MRTKQIQSALAGRRFGKRVFKFETLRSTNDRALEDIDAELVSDGDVIVANRQLAGRGTGERSWESRSPDGLWTSVIVLGGTGATPLPFLPAVALADVLTSSYGLHAHLKWPNDVMIGKRKIAGILVEGRAKHPTQASVIGIGLNIKQEHFDGELAGRATSLRMEGIEVEHRDLILVELLARMSRLDEKGIDLVDAFRERCRMIGRTLDTAGGRKLKVRDLSPEGFLLLENEDGETERWVSRSDAEVLPGWLDESDGWTPPPPID